MNNRELVPIEELLYRRAYCTPLRNYLNPDGSATSRVFKLRPKDNGELSVDISSLTTKENSIRDTAKFILFEITNKTVHELELLTYKDRLPDGSNDAHAVIVGLELDDEIKPTILAKGSKRVVLG